MSQTAARIHTVRCRRKKAEQAYIFTLCRGWDIVSDSIRDMILEQIRRASDGDALAGRALYDVIVRGKDPKRVSERTGVELLRIYKMRRDFLNGFPIS